MLRSLRALRHRHINERWRKIYSFNFIFMLTTIAVVLLILWLLGVVTSYTLGGFIHILLVIAIVMILVRLIKGEPVL